MIKFMEDNWIIFSVPTSFSVTIRKPNFGNIIFEILQISLLFHVYMILPLLSYSKGSKNAEI